jgi:hypothetical protein
VLPFEWLVPGGPTAALLHSTDWSRTPLGPMERWPKSLCIAVGICLNSRFPMFVWWGPELINLYNDAYIPVLGKRHPEAFGRPARAIWTEISPVVGPQAEAVMRRGESTWNERVLLVMERHGYTENTWFTWWYSPIPDDRGGIGGVFCACTEDTSRVLVERERNRLLEEVEGRAQAPHRSVRPVSRFPRGAARAEDRVQSIRAGFQIHLAKPIEPAELLATVASVARRL